MTTNNGLLLLDKPTGVTSHDVVARVRKVVNEQRVGHAGTLDPMATGLLVVAVGPATRLLRFAQSQTKRYSGVVTFGIATDSLDADGEVLERREVPQLTHEAVNEVARGMLGPQQQTPPMVSALRINGRRLHALAREGVEVDRPARDITIETFALEALASPHEWSFEVTCSVGTYVRVVLADLAAQLGTIGHLSALRRLASGTHLVENALTLDEFERGVNGGNSAMLAPRALVEQLEAIVVTDDEARRLRHGQRVNLAASADGEIAALSERGALVGVLRRRGDLWQPTVVMPDEETEVHE
ncbi:MAG: truB [Acidimicrobiaceae bacterium]|nr:truB [Acidimicrobiaceae bacterium]